MGIRVRATDALTPWPAERCSRT
ncbi:MAG: hypothetical protein QOC85_1857, partial [Streptomyces sp.]|nr:hypothetical protein [Streptomyces sp.]